MLLPLLLILTVVPLTELMILLRLAERFSWERTLLLVVVTGVIGVFLARREGVKTMTKIKTDLNRGVMPTDAMLEGVLILFAGMVLVTPGILTDALGFALLIGPIRRWVRKRLVRAVRARMVRAVRARMTIVSPFDNRGDFVDVQPLHPRDDEEDVTDHPRLDHGRS